MRKIVGIYNLNLLLCVLSLSILTSCKETLVQKIILDQTGTILKVGDALYLATTIIPSDADNSSIAWSSSNGGVATVINEAGLGLVLAVAEGNATITATAMDGSGASASCEVTVVSKSNSNDGNNISDIQGHWVALDCDYKGYVNGELDYEDYEIETDWGYYFDGSGALYEFDFDYEHGSVIGDYEFRGRYNYQNGELEITAKVDDDGKYELISLTPSKMVLSLIWDYFEYGVQYKEVEKYTLQKFVIDK